MGAIINQVQASQQGLEEAGLKHSWQESGTTKVKGGGGDSLGFQPVSRRQARALSGAGSYVYVVSGLASEHVPH